MMIDDSASMPFVLVGLTCLDCRMRPVRMFSVCGAGNWSTSDHAPKTRGWVGIFLAVNICVA
ncbi:hypothetical protein BDQ94DRAFT_132056 [Aspergillus welwitschiae]|uniref:Uncharacterized protein n=1 Tax=Aspergillus welwitschiae TaxID=1341132 RepID=A0A3F3QIE5_9EURO|nr:hypothetical protein BDQ94DRAFT_132056 [Aspergillus welwitschiae]RDH38951.1 hypothetical protein BDQ94DRAFT_132056 [Aspergillus welwitschiae]